LAATIAHENAHNTLTMATALGHLKLHIKIILELTPKIPPADKPAKALRMYLGIIIESSKYAQETAATMSAYTALRGSYGPAVADQYLKRLKRPSPYTTFVDPAIDLFSKHSVPYQHWGGYMMFLASLAMNTDINHGTHINGMNVAIAGLIQQAKFARWKGHDMQPRAYDNVEQAIDRVVRSVLIWEACENAARELDTKALMGVLAKRETAKAEDMMRAAVVSAQKHFDKMYK